MLGQIFNLIRTVLNDWKIIFKTIFDHERSFLLSVSGREGRLRRVQ